MKQKNYLIYGGFILVLCILYLASSTDIIYKEEEQPVYTISVLLNETTEALFEHIKLGMKQVEKEWVVELNVVTLYEAYDTEQQAELLKREVSYGAQAIILFPTNEKKLKQVLENSKINVPIICVGYSEEKNIGDVWIQYDPMQRGKEIGEKLIENRSQKVYTFSRKKAYESHQYQIAGIRQVLDEAQIEVTNLTYEDGEELKKLYKQILGEKIKVSIVGLDAITTKHLLSLYNENEITEEGIALYGIGYTTDLLEGLDQNHIEGLSIHNEYATGYLSLLTTIELLENKKIKSDISISGGIVTPYNMYDSAYEKIIFPIY